MAKENVKHPGTSLWLKHIGMQIVAGGSAGCVEVIILWITVIVLIWYMKIWFHSSEHNHSFLHLGIYNASNGPDKNKISTSIQWNVVYKSKNAVHGYRWLHEKGIFDSQNSGNCSINSKDI